MGNPSGNLDQKNESRRPSRLCYCIGISEDYSRRLHDEGEVFRCGGYVDYGGAGCQADEWLPDWMQTTPVPQTDLAPTCSPCFPVLTPTLLKSHKVHFAMIQPAAPPILPAASTSRLRRRSTLFHCDPRWRGLIPANCAKSQAYRAIGKRNIPSASLCRPTNRYSCSANSIAAATLTRRRIT